MARRELNLDAPLLFLHAKDNKLGLFRERNTSEASINMSASEY